MNNTAKSTRPPPPCALTIAGSDSCGGAGIQADLKSFEARGVAGATAITALTAQNTRGITAVRTLDPGFVAEQIRAVTSEQTIAATKTGMLADGRIIHAVAECLTECDVGRLVVDPVMVATSGARLLDRDAEERMRTLLLARADLVTPNRPEAAALAGRTEDAPAEELAEVLLGAGCGAVLIKGGHDHSDPVVDLLVTRSGSRRFSHRRIGTGSVHGTGCALAASITAELARGESLEEAVGTAIDWLQSMLARTWLPRHGNLRMLPFAAHARDAES